MLTLYYIFCLWLAVNALHAAWVETRRCLWERRVARGPDGLLPDAAAFTCGNGPVALLLIHGFADTPMIWKRLAERLAATGAFTCRAMRLPGSAEPAPAARRQSLALWRKQVDREIDGLLGTHARVWLVGHSMGAALAIDAALRRPAELGGLVLFAPLIRVSRARAPLLPPGTWFRLARVVFALSPTFESCFSANGRAVDDPAFTYTRDRFIPFSVYRGLFQLTRSNADKAPRLRLPLIAWTADDDAVIDTPAARRWLARCPDAKQTRPLAEIGHVIPLENGWQTFADEAAAFVLAREHNETGRGAQRTQRR